MPVVGANGDQVPAAATVVVVNLTTPDATASSTFTAYPNGTAQPAATTLSFGPGQPASDQATVAIGTSGAIAIHNTAATPTSPWTSTATRPASTTASATFTYDSAGWLPKPPPPPAPAPTLRRHQRYPNNNANANPTAPALPSPAPGRHHHACYNSADQLTSTTLNGGNRNTNYTYDPERQPNPRQRHHPHLGQRQPTGHHYQPGRDPHRLTYDPLDPVTTQQDGTTTTGYSYAGMTTSPAAILDTNSNLVDSLIDLPGGVAVTVPAAGLTSSTWSYTNLQGDTTLTATDTGTPKATPSPTTLGAHPYRRPRR